jgi:hypothetical protein
VRWNGSERSTTFVNSSQLTASILASDVAVASTANINVVNPAPGGGTSNSASFTVNNPVPVVSALDPSSAIAGASAFALTVDGSNFVSGSVVQWNGTTRTTTFVSSTRLTAAIAAADVASAATANVTVFNAAPGGGGSNAMGFAVMSGPPPTPVIRSFSPASIMAGGPEFILTVHGSGFVQGTLVRWNGSDRSTTFVNSTQINAAILATDIASTGTATVTVSNQASGGGISAALTYYVSPQGVGVIERVSVDNNDAQFEGAASYVWFAGISSDGRFVAFDTTFHNVDPNDPTKVSQQVFVRDTCRGAPVGCTPSTVQASVANDGSQGNNANLDAAISGDGRFVAFSSFSSNLVLDDSNGFEDVMLHDTCAGAPVGCMPSTIRVSIATDGTQGDSWSAWPTISANGRFVAFYSEASNLVPNDTNGVGDSFVRDTCFGAPAGCTLRTVRISVANDGSQGLDYPSTIPSISANGRFVAFDSGANNLTPGWDVFVRDTCAEAPSGCTPSTTLVSVANDGNQENSSASYPVISANGRFVSFLSTATNLGARNSNGEQNAFVRDTCFGAPPGCTPSTTLVSVGSDGNEGNYGVSPAWWAPISGDGRFVAFNSWSWDMLPGGNRQGDIFVHDTCVGASADCAPSTVRVNVASNGAPGSFSDDQPWSEVAISGDGRFVAFDSDANDLVSGDTNCPSTEYTGAIGCFDVFLARTGAVADPTNTSMASSYASSVDSYLRTPPAVVGAVALPQSFGKGIRPQLATRSLVGPRRRAITNPRSEKLSPKQAKP